MVSYSFDVTCSGCAENPPKSYEAKPLLPGFEYSLDLFKVGPQTLNTGHPY
jgi:hypothetical protein